MKKLIALLSFLTFTLFALGAFANEACPSITQIKAIYDTIANPLPSNGIMPYPVSPSIADPLYDNHDDVSRYFVVTRNFTSLRGDPVPFVAFAVFTAPAGLTTTQAIAQAKTYIDAAGETSTSVDYPHFLIGDDGRGSNIYFDVCLYSGSFNVPLGTRNTTQENWSTFPLVMADLSPGESAADLKNKLVALEAMVNKQSKVKVKHSYEVIEK